MATETYFTGTPCKHGHIDFRFKASGNCCECNRQRSRVRNLSTVDHELKKARERDWYWRNHDAARASNREAVNKHALLNPGKMRARCRASQAAKLQRTPPWADLKKIQAFYEACPEGYEVDHEVPLQGENVSGLHVFENLQYLTIEANRAKGNRF